MLFHWVVKTVLVVQKGKFIGEVLLNFEILSGHWLVDSGLELKK